MVAVLLGLGVWQIERRAWKLDLIARVEDRIHAEPVAAPGPEAWGSVNGANDEYRHVRLQGRFLPGETFVQAVTDLGGGFWVLAPFRTETGFVVLVNRGFVPPERRDPTNRPATPPGGDPTTITGLLRLSEPKGGFLRSNDPAAGRWYSRDVAAIAQAQGLGTVAPYFVDADAGPTAGGWPVGGLTVVTFPNNHLVYALTWFTLAVMVATGALYALKRRD
nr:SURF1 family protein [Ancylobacter lacus]